MNQQTTIVSCSACGQRLTIPSNLGNLAVTCTACGHRWEWRPRTRRGRLILLAALAFVAVVAATVGTLWLLQNKRLSAWEAKLTSADRSFQNGDFNAAKHSLDEVRQDWADLPAWYWLPMTRSRLGDLRDQREEQQQKVSQALGQERRLTAWGSTLKLSARHLESGRYALAEDELRPVEKELGLAKQWQCHAATRGRLTLVEDKLQAQKKELTAFHQEEASVRDAVAALREPLNAGEYDEALKVIAKAAQASPHDDPLLQSLETFVKRLQAEKRAWQQSDSQALDHMAAQGIEWKKTRRAHTSTQYVAFMSKYPDSPFADEAKARLVDVEVANIFKGNPGMLPPAERVGGPRGRTYSIINIHNDTPHELTLRYSGPDSFFVTLAPREKASIEVVVGHYKLTASVPSAKVRDFAGEERSTGDDYHVTYYITNPLDFRDFGRPRPQALDLLQPFQPWPRKRAVPAYLK
jgi:hypothetical protein